MRNAATAVLVGVVLTAGAVVAPAVGVLAALPATVAVTAALLTVLPARAPRPREALAALAGAVSAVTTLVVVVTTPGLSETAGTLGLLECAALAVLIFATVRSGRGRAAVVGTALATGASASCILRVLPPASILERFGACVAWSLGAVIALALGGYLRTLERRRLDAIAAARQAQRFALSRDLHDFVAHDVSGIVAQAQAARFVADQDAATEALTRIEAAGLRALAAMDRALESLADDARAASPDRPGAAALPELVARFGAEGAIETRLELGRLGSLPDDVGETVYRLVSEALTNVRRHAAGATRVTVAVDRSGDELRLTVTDDGTGPGAARTDGGTARPDGGTGLAALRERTAALGGTLAAGPIGDDRGWRVSATLRAEAPR